MNLKALENGFRGEILTAGSPEYEASRKIWNSMIDRRPRAIADQLHKALDRAVGRCQRFRQRFGGGPA